MNIIDFLITPALANTPAPQGGGMMQIVMFVSIIAIFYFMLIRPQSKRAKEHRKMLIALQRGDEVVTNGGVVGKISQVADDFVTLKVSDNVDVLLQKHAVAALLPKGTIQVVSNQK